jgi:proteasome lid subunit RPN8/RPN11
LADPSKLYISADVAAKIRQHGVETYPHECCGALLGHDVNTTEQPSKPREILDLFPLINRREDSRQNRFSVNPRDVMDADRAAKSCGLDVIGWYHSHPDHPAEPSEYDREHAWPWYSYVIVSVHQGIPQQMTSWQLNDNRAGYTQESIEIRKDATAPS